MYRMAAGASLSGYVRSMSGVTLPDWMSSVRTARSSAFSEQTNVRSFWPTNGDRPIARTGQFAVTRRVVALLPTLARLGLGRVLAASAAPALPAPAADQVRALTTTARGARNVRDEQSVIPELFQQAQALTTFHANPLAVVTASQTLKTGGWAGAQQQLAALSTSRIHRVSDSTHTGLLEDQHGSADSVRAINDVIASVRTGYHLNTR
jgi:hypothetical protein